jgi:Flp pilus assembly protein TadG
MTAVSDFFKKEDGAEMVEFALVFMLLVLILAGIIQFGLVFNTLLVLQDAARNAARSAAVSTLSDSQIISNIIQSVPSLPLNSSNIVITPSTRTRGQILTVTITYNYQMPVTLGVLSASYPLTARASMVSEN